jgi:hypothetical protein
MEPHLLRQFLAMLGPYPWGSLLRLDEKRFALVVRPNAAEPENPLARVIDTGAGEPALSEEQTPLRHLDGSATLEAVDPAALGIDVSKLLHHTQSAS